MTMKNYVSNSSTNQPTRMVGTGVVILRRVETEIEVLLIRRGKPPRVDDWSIPGGCQELGETVRESATREIKEETNLTIRNLDLVDVVDATIRDATGNISVQWTLIDFRAFWDGGTAKAGSDATEVRWVPIRKLKKYDLWDETLRVIIEATHLPNSRDKVKYSND